MLIRCPTCASGYDLDPALVPEGRILRCAHCRDAWVHVAPSDAAAGPEIRAEVCVTTAAPPPAPMRGPRWRVRLRPSPRRLAGAAAALALAALARGSTAAVAGKARVVAAYPPSAAVFAALGLPVNVVGLALGDLRSAVETGDGPPTLTLEGRITNLRGGPTAVPPLRIAVRDGSRRELYTWTAPAPKAELASGETVSFHGRLAAPPSDGQDLAVSFSEAPAAPRRVAELAAADR